MLDFSVLLPLPPVLDWGVHHQSYFAYACFVNPSSLLPLLTLISNMCNLKFYVYLGLSSLPSSSISFIIFLLSIFETCLHRSSRLALATEPVWSQSYLKHNKTKQTSKKKNLVFVSQIFDSPALPPSLPLVHPHLTFTQGLLYTAQLLYYWGPFSNMYFVLCDHKTIWAILNIT